LSGLPIKTWLHENEKIVVNEREDERYYESYWVGPKQKDPERVSIPVLVGYLKKLQQGEDCILVGWVWTIDLNHPYVKTVMENPALRDAAVQKLKQTINNHFRIVFLPDDSSFSRIRVFTLLLVNRITKTKLHDTIVQSWLKYATVLFEFEKQYRRRPGSNNPSQYV
jgi:hypothetical protein